MLHCRTRSWGFQCLVAGRVSLLDRPGDGPPTWLRSGPDEIRTRTFGYRRATCCHLHHGPTAARDARPQVRPTHVWEERADARARPSEGSTPARVPTNVPAIDACLTVRHSRDQPDTPRPAYI